VSTLRRIPVGLAIVLFPLLTVAQTYPNKPIRVIVSVAGGASVDVVARMVAPGLSSLLGQQLVIDNRGGAGGLIGAELAAKAPPDGYTLFFSGPSFTILPHLQKHVAYDTNRDFAPISLICAGPFLLVVHPSVPVRSVKELTAFARAQPGRLSYSSAGSGTSNHLAMELLKSMAGIDITHVPYKIASQAVTDLLGGSVNLTLSSIPLVLQHIKTGRLRLLGVSSLKRSPQLPEVATISESGVPDYEAITWFGLLAPAKTPRQVIDRVHDAVAEVVRKPDIRSQFEILGYNAVGGSAAEFFVFVRRQSEKYAKVVKLSGAKAD
jgi:tripartite-type tricarboxylate transporter receptor subunit TctC